MAQRTIVKAALTACILAAVLLLAANSVCQDAAPPATEPQSLELFDHMLEVKALVRDLARLSGDSAKKAEALPLVTQLQGHIIAAKEMVPPAAETRPEPERAAFVLSFRKAMTELLREVAEVELDIIEDRNAEAVERITTTLIEMRDRAHETFQAD